MLQVFCSTWSDENNFCIRFLFLIKRPVKTIGVNAIEIYGLKSGNNFLAITDHAGQHEVAINGCSFGTLFKKSSASSTVHKSAPIATSTTSENPNSFNAPFTFSGVTVGPNCPTNAGAMAATTSLPVFIA